MPDEQNLEVVDNRTGGRFEVHLGGEIAFAEYRLEGDSIVFPHTIVPDAFAGKGVGGTLVKHGLAYARERSLKVKPTCSFFAGYISKHPEHHDLVHPDFRAHLGITS